jgi:hypothetical protein
MPARKELPLSAMRRKHHTRDEAASNLRNAHNRAQSEQHKEAVPHGESCALRAGASAVEDARKQKQKGSMQASVCTVHASLLGDVRAGSCMVTEGVGVVSGEALLASANTTLQGFIGLAGAKTRAGTLPVPQSSLTTPLARPCQDQSAHRQIPPSKACTICVSVGIAIMDLDDCKYCFRVTRFPTASNLRLRKPRNHCLTFLSYVQLQCHMLL